MLKPNHLSIPLDHHKFLILSVRIPTRFSIVGRRYFLIAGRTPQRLSIASASALGSLSPTQPYPTPRPTPIFSILGLNDVLEPRHVMGSTTTSIGHRHAPENVKAKTLLGFAMNMIIHHHIPLMKWPFTRNNNTTIRFRYKRHRKQAISEDTNFSTIPFH